MTLPEPARSGKPRRLGLYAPFAVALAAALIWSGVWFWVRAQAQAQLEGARARLAGAGYDIGWKSATYSGFPFRLDVDLEDVRLREPSGWALATPLLKAEAWAYAPGHWVIVAPAGAAFTRPQGGAVSVAARALRASISDVGGHPPRLSVEGLDLTFTPAPGARPFFVTAAKQLHFHTKAGPNDQGAFYFELDQASARLTGLFGRIAQGKPVSVAGDAIFSHASALAGRDWPSAVRAWSSAGGSMAVHQARIIAGDAVLDARSGTLTVGDDGRLRGSLSAALRQAPRALATMSEAGAISPEAAGAATTVAAANSKGDVTTVTIDFQAGETTLGPASIGPAPRVF